jgi:hypothetical protein
MVRLLAIVGLVVAVVGSAEALTKRQARRMCRKQVPACVAELLAPPTTTTTSGPNPTIAPTTTLPPTIRTRQVTEILDPFHGSYGDLTLAVEADGRIHLRFAPRLVDRFVCQIDFRIVQGTRQADVSIESGIQTCGADPMICTTLASGVVGETWLTCPLAWIDVNQAFRFDWEDLRLEVP